MDFSLLENLIYGLISGLTEFLPVSTQAHRALMLKLFGAASEGPVLRLLVHLGAFLALLSACRGQITHLRREQALARIPKRRRKRQPDQKAMLDIQIIKTAFIPALLGFVLYFKILKWESTLSVVASFLIANGIILFIPRITPSGNKDSRSMSRLDSILIGLGAALAMVPGISRTGITTSIAQLRGADRQQALSWSLLLSIPIMVCLMLFDVYTIISTGMIGFTFILFMQYILSAAASYVGAYLAISVMRFIAVKTGFSGFAYYSWGAALFSFIFFLTI